MTEQKIAKSRSLSMPLRETVPARIPGFAALFVAALYFALAHAATAQGRPDSFADMVEDLLPAVVNISTLQTIEAGEGGRRVIPNLPPNSPFQDFFDEFFGERGGQNAQPRQRMSLGSGFIISADGYIVTNNHVIGEADEITVTMTNGDDYTAELVGRDASLDLALLKIEAGDDLPFVEWGDSEDVRVGDWIVAVGNPFNLGGSVTAGIVSARGRNIQAGPYDNFIQTDASINRGNSGGPMFNLEGEVIGVNTMIFSPTGGNVGIGFAIPSNQASLVISQLQEFGETRRGWIGVTIQGVTEEVAEGLGLEEARGAIVSSVVDGGPADRAGIEPFDVILEFDGRRIDDVSELPRYVAETPVNQDVPLTVWRNGERLQLELTTGLLEANQPEAGADGSTPQQESPPEDEMGMGLVSLTNDLRAQYEIPDDIDGVVITRLNATSNAARNGVRVGDVIVQVNQTRVDTVDSIEDEMTRAREQGRSQALFRLYRDGAYFLVPLPIGSEGE